MQRFVLIFPRRKSIEKQRKSSVNTKNRLISVDLTDIYSELIKMQYQCPIHRHKNKNFKRECARKSANLIRRLFFGPKFGSTKKSQKMGVRSVVLTQFYSQSASH